MSINRRWLGLVLAVLLAGIAYATLGPEAWQIRLGLPYLVEHFLAYFTLTIVACLAWPRPLHVAAVLVPLAVALEAAQGLTPDRTPDLATALSAAGAVVAGALLCGFVLAVRRKWRKPGDPGPLAQP